MNTHIIETGNDKDGNYWAKWANDNTVFSGETPEGAINSLLTERYPHVWHLNDMANKGFETVIKEGSVGQCSLWYNRITHENIPPIRDLKEK